MTDVPAHHDGVHGLVKAVAVALAGAAASLALVLVLVNHPDWWRGFLAAAVVSVLSAAVSVPPLAWGMRQGINQTVAAYFLAAFLRAAVSLGGCLLAVLAGEYPAAATLVLMVVFYFAVLGAESTVVARALWSSNMQN
jgi:hypothetical protein